MGSRGLGLGSTLAGPSKLEASWKDSGHGEGDLGRQTDRRSSGPAATTELSQGTVQVAQSPEAHVLLIPTPGSGSCRRC